MICSIYDLQTGAIQKTIFAGMEYQRDLNIKDGQGWIAGDFDGDLFYVADGAAIERPQAPEAATAESGYIISGIPAGTRVTIVDAIGDETLFNEITDETMTNLPITFADFGTYRFEIVPPWPHLARIQTVEVA